MIDCQVGKSRQSFVDTCIGSPGVIISRQVLCPPAIICTHIYPEKCTHALAALVNILYPDNFMSSCCGNGSVEKSLVQIQENNSGETKESSAREKQGSATPDIVYFQTSPLYGISLRCYSCDSRSCPCCWLSVPRDMERPRRAEGRCP